MGVAVFGSGLFSSISVEDGVSLYRDATSSMRTPLASSELVTPTKPPRIVVIDDDPAFGRIMERAGFVKNVHVTYCRSVEDFYDLERTDFDVAVIDYNLEYVDGFEVTKVLEDVLPRKIPVILVSQTMQQNVGQWPESIREFVHKVLGPMAILDAAFEAHEVSRIYEKIEKKSWKH